MMQTAVEWLESQLKDVKYNPLEKNGYSNALDKLYAQAKAMEKEQIVMAYHNGYSDAIQSEPKQYEPEQYYTETYGK